MAAYSKRSLLRGRQRANGSALVGTLPRTMSRADICNVEPITAADADALGLPAAVAYLDAGTLDALGCGDSWTLTDGGASWAE